MIIRFTIEAQHFIPAEGKGVEPSSRQARTALAKRPGQPYPATFRSVDPPGIELGFQTASLVSSRWTMSPFRIQWTCRGIEPRFPGCKPGVFPLDEQPVCSFHCFAYPRYARRLG